MALGAARNAVSSQVAVVRVWVSDWQMDRSGTPFSVGKRVQWTVSADVDTEFAAMVLGSEAAETINYIEDPRAGEDGITLSGSVAAIEAIQCCFEAAEGERGTWPVPGTAQISSVAYAAQWVPDEPPRRFVGWIVDLNHHYVIPKDPLA